MTNRRTYLKVWEVANGPIPEGHEVHHLCFKRCNVLEHLAVLTVAQHKAIHRNAQHAVRHPDHDPDWVLRSRRTGSDYHRCAECNRQWARRAA